MNFTDLIELAQKMEPGIATAIETLDPAIASTVAVADGVIQGTERLYKQLTDLRAAKDNIDPAVWDAQSASFASGAADIARAELGG